jgi:ubiquinone/menaquinone biosynthesis C-methylase UbiE
MLNAFIRFNDRLCQRIESHLPQATPNIWLNYIGKVAEEMNSRTAALVVDVGGGWECPFSDLREPGCGARIVAVDVSAEDLRQNRDVDESRVADVTRQLPFDNDSVDIMTSRSVLEHFPHLEPFLRESHRVLRPGGVAIHIFPSRYAPFALINRALPHRFSQWLLHRLYAESRERGGHLAYYDHCSPRAMTLSFQQAGFTVRSLEVSYLQSSYYRFFLPLFLLSAGYELLIRALHLRSLCAQVLIVAEKRSGS